MAAVMSCGFIILECSVVRFFVERKIKGFLYQDIKNGKTDYNRQVSPGLKRNGTPVGNEAEMKRLSLYEDVMDLQFLL
jgi:hypothetical protein